MSKSKAFSNSNVSLTPQIFYILLALATKERHGYEIMKQVENDSKSKVKLGPGTLYGAIKRMLEEKLIVELDTTHSRRKYYKLTVKKQGIKNYLNINKYNVIGGILLLPFALVLGSDFIGRVVQGDFSHPNLGVVGFLSRSILYGGYDKLLWAILVFAPLMAAILNLIPLLSSLK